MVEFIEVLNESLGNEQVGEPLIKCSPSMFVGGGAVAPAAIIIQAREKLDKGKPRLQSLRYL